MTTILNTFEDTWETCIDTIDDLKSTDIPTTVTGTLNLWNKSVTILPEKFSSLQYALGKCLGRDTEDIIIKQEGNKYYLDCYHHDGINHFIIELNENL